MYAMSVCKVSDIVTGEWIEPWPTLTMYIGDPQSVAAIMLFCRCLAKPKSASEKKIKGIKRMASRGRIAHRLSGLAKVGQLVEPQWDQSMIYVGLMEK